LPFYVDTSAFLKLVVTESGSAPMARWALAHEDELFSSDLMRTEALRAARRHSPEAIHVARQRLEAITLVSLSPGVCEHAATLDPAILRTLDSLHLAAALTVADELEGVVTYDDRLAAAARIHGVAVVSP
jgi:predicted nucleic acid-binding protein